MCTVVSGSMSTVTTAVTQAEADTPTLQVGPRRASAPQALDRPHQVILARVGVDHGRHQAAMPGEALREADVLGQRVEIGHRRVAKHMEGHAPHIEAEGADFRCEKRLVEEARRLNTAGKMLAPIIDDARLMDVSALRRIRLLFEDFPKNHCLVLVAQPDS